MYWKAYFNVGPSLYSTKGSPWDDVLKRLGDLNAVAYFVADKIFVVRMNAKVIEEGPEGFVEISRCDTEIKDMSPILTVNGDDVDFGFDAKNSLSDTSVSRCLTIKDDGTYTKREIG